MYGLNMKRNARKSTHSGKVRQTSSTFQEFQSTSSHSALNHISNLASSSPHPKDRSIWDTEFTAPEPTPHDSSSNVICISEEPAVKLKPIPGNIVKGCVASLKNKLKPDRNIFSALTKPANQSQQSFNSSGITKPTNQSQRSFNCSVLNKPTNPSQQSFNSSGITKSANQSQRSFNNSLLNKPAYQSQRSFNSSTLTKPANRSQQSFNIRPTNTRHTPAILHHPSKTSRNLAKLYGSEFVFKKPTAPPPVSRLHPSSSSSRTSQPSSSRSTSAAQSGHVQNRQRNRHRDYSSETRRFTALPPKARSGANKRPQYASEINHRFCRDNLFSSRPFLEENNWSSAFGGKLSSSNSKLSNVPLRLPGNEKSVFKTSRQWSQFSSSRPQKNVRTKSTGKSPNRGTSQATKKRFAMKRALMRQNISPSVNSETFIDLCHEKTGKKTQNVAARAPRNHVNLSRVHDPHYVTQMSIENLSRRRNSSTPKSVPPLTAQPSTNLLHNNFQKSPNLQSNSQQKSSSHVDAGSKDNTRVNYKNSCSTVKVIPTEQLEFRLSPLKFGTKDSGDFDEVDGRLFVSFKTQSGLERYLRTPPEKPANGPSGALSNVASPSAGKQKSRQQVNYKTQIEQFERQLKIEIQRNSNREILSPVLHYYGVSIRKNIISKGAGSINLRSHGIRLYSKKLKRFLSRKRRLTELRKKCKNKAESKNSNNCKEHTATRTTGLKIKFSVSGLDLKNNSLANKNKTVSKQDQELNLTSNSNRTSQEQTEEQTTPKTTSNKLPIEESIPFKPFEKEVTSAKSAFISDALDKYLEDEKEHTPSLLNSYVHPLLQNKASSVTFKMPSKQSSSFKTLDMALHQRQMARIKSKVPTVAQTAEKLAKKLQHYSGVNKMTTEQAVSSGNEKGITETPSTTVPNLETDSQHALQTEERKETPFALEDKAITDANADEINLKEKLSIKERMESVKKNFKSALQKTRHIQTQQQSSRSDSKKKESVALEEKLKTVKTKLRKMTALQKKSPIKSKSQTNWVTKFKIVNSRLVQQLNSPGQNAHLINSDKGEQTPSEHSAEPPQAQVGGIKIEEGSEPIANTTAAESKGVKVGSRDKGKEKSKSSNEFVRLDQQITCTKEFCRLGCICDSINLSLSVEQLTKHCRKPSCMFECVCQRVTESVRILRTRKRPNIFKESSMLFYDGLGMFSNNAYADSPVKNPGEKKTGILQSLKPKTGGNTCARAKVYRGKPGARNRTARCLPGQGEEPKVQVSSGSIESQSQVLPKSVMNNIKSSNGNQQTIYSIPAKSSVNRNKEPVQTVLYTPVHLPVAGQANPVVLYAPVNRLPGMPRAPKSAVIFRQQSEIEEYRKTGQSKTTPVESALSQVLLGSDSRIIDSKVKPVAVVSPSSAKLSNQESSDGKLDAALSLNPSGETIKSLDGTMLDSQKSSSISAGTMCISPEMPDLSTDLSHTSAPVSNEVDLSASGREDIPKNLVIHTRNQVNGTLSPSSVKGIAEEGAHCSENVEVLPQPEPSKVSSDVPMAMDTGEPGETNESIAVEQTPPIKSPKEATSDSLEYASSNEGAGTISAIISRIESPLSLQATGTVSGLSPTNVLNDTELQPSPEILSCQEKTDSASPELSPTGTSEKTTAQTLNPSNAILNLSKVLEAAPNDPISDSSLKLSEALASTMVSGTQAATTSKQETSDRKGSIKVPGFSFVPGMEGSKKKSLTKTQVFLPGVSVSAINNKSDVPATTRSPLLIEIQSECNWGNQRNDILSSIAKHTASKEGGSGVVRVGKFVVEILSKDSQKHPVPPMITCNIVPATKTVNSVSVQPLAAPKVQQSSQPAKMQPFAASVVPQTNVCTTVPEPKAVGTKMKTRSKAKLPPYPELNTRPQFPFSMPEPPPYPELNTRPHGPFSMPRLPPYPELNTRPHVPFSMQRLPQYTELNRRIRIPFSVPRLPQYSELSTRRRVPFSMPNPPPYPELITRPHVPFSQPYVQVLPDLSVFPTEKPPPPTVRQQLDNLDIQKVVTLANAGTVTTAPHSGTVPLLTSLPPGSFLLSDGKNAAGYLVPLSAIKEHIVSPGAKSVPQEQPTNMVSPTFTSPSLPTGMTASQKSSVPSYDIVPSILTSSDSQLSSPANCLPRVSASTFDGSSMVASCTTSQVLGGYHGTGNLLSQSTGTPTENGKYVNGQNKLGENEAFKADLPDLGEEGDLVINETNENKIVNSKDDCAGDDEDSFVDVESLSDTEEGSSLLIPTLKSSFANPTSATNMVTAQTPPPSASSTLSSFSNLVKSRRKAPHVLRQPMPEVEEARARVRDVKYINKTQLMSRGIHVIERQARTGSPVGSWQPPSSSKGKRKRKSPVMQKQSVLALDEPEFTETFFELASDDELDEDDQEARHKRDRPNKVLHLIKERQRRQNQSDLFSELKVLMLNDEDQKVPKVTILGMAMKEIKLQESKSFANEVECSKLKQEHHLKRSKLASLLGHSVLDFPLPLLDQKEQDFAEYSKDLHSGEVNSEGFVSATASETASQDMDSECADLSSLEDDEERGATLENRGVLRIEHKERDTTADDGFDMVDVESHSSEGDYETLTKPYPSSQYSLGDVVMSDGTNDTLPASSQDNDTVEMQPDLDGISYKDSDLFSQDDPNLAFPMKLTAVSKSPVAINDDEEDTPASATEVESRLQDTVNREHETNDSDSPDCNKTYAERTILKEQPMDVQSNNNPLQQSSNSCSDDLTESVEGNSEITSQTSSDSTPVENSEDDSPSPSVGSSDTSAKDTALPGDLSEFSPRNDESEEPSSGSADVSVEYTELKEPLDQNVKDLEPKDPISIDVDEESEDDGFEMVDSIPATQTSDVEDSDDVIMVNEEPCPGGNKPAKKTTPTSPSKQNTPEPDSNKERPSEGPSDPPVKLNVLAINIKAGIVRVTCDSGEVIPLAVVKASLDGTMQVAVEGDISSEKVEELLSKPEVMECLEKVADQACEKLNKL